MADNVGDNEAEIASEGDHYQMPDGSIVKLQGGQWVPVPTKSTWQDIKDVAGPALTQGTLGVTSTPGTLLDLGAAGAQKVAGWVGGQDNAAQKAIQGFRQQIEPATYSGQMRQLAESWPGVNTEPQTTGGTIAQKALQWAPGVATAALTGPEAIVPALLKGTAAAGASEAAGAGAQAGKGMLPEWAQPYAEPIARLAGAASGWGAMGAANKYFTPGEYNPLLASQTATVRGAGAPVDVAQATNSPRLRAILGAPSGGQANAVSKAMLDEAGVNIPAGATAPPRTFTGKALADLSPEGQRLAANTPMAVDNTLTTSLGSRANEYAASSASDAKMVQDELSRFNGMHGSGLVNSISGPQYWQLRNEWASSGHPVLRAMGRDLDAAMDRSLAGTPQAGAWGQWRQKWANTDAVNEAAIEAAKNGTTTLSPRTVFSNFHPNMETPLKKLAEYSIAVTKPIEPAAPSKLGKIAGKAAEAAGYIGGGFAGAHLPGMSGFFGAEPGLAPTLAGGSLGALGFGLVPGGLSRSAVRAAGPALEWNQKYGTLDPATAAKLLATESPRMVPVRPNKGNQTPQ